MIKLAKDSKLYHNIVFVVWSLLHYYQDLCGYYAGESATDGFHCKFFPCGKITKIRATVPIIKEAEHRDVREMRIILNEYLQLLLQDSDVPPYAVSEDIFIEPLYVTDIVTDGSYFIIDTLFINSKEAHEYMIQNEQKYIERSK